MWGSDTFTTVVSSTTMNVQNITAHRHEPRVEGRRREGRSLTHRV